MPSPRTPLRPTMILLLAVAVPIGMACTPAADTAAHTASGVAPGVEVLLRDSLHLLQGKRVGLITNHSGRDREGTSTIDLLHRAPGVRLTALFAPEHGLRGTAEAGVRIAADVDSATGVPIYSLYGETRVPTPEMLADIDVLVYDIQDVGARVYTYEWTMVLAAEAAARAGKPFVVLDRPNPIRGDRVEGGVLREEFSSFVGLHPVALRYGLTAGELLRYLVGIGRVQANVTVVPMSGYRRSMWWEETEIPWTRPSPNLRDMDATILYTGTVFFEGTNLSEGRGTDRPFRLVGAPWLDAAGVAGTLNALELPGVRFDVTSRRIGAGQKWAGDSIPMVEVVITDRDRVRPVEVGARMLEAMYALHRDRWQWRISHFDRLAGTDEFRRAIESGSVGELLERWDAESRAFAERTMPYRIYE
ncbi:MAG TPA: DUF1343 domain-containing protein [Gemmatimonadaceae bacterium]|nr:DUF1343 domain-containing protein [Gemmatimonadaceae bacterium]